MNAILDKCHLKEVIREQNFSIGDKVRIHYKIKEGSKERIQKYEGTVIAIKNQGAGKSLTVYRVSYDVGVERIFPLYAPTIDKIEHLRSSKVRRAKLYYLKKKAGKEGRLKEIKREPKPDGIYAKSLELKSKLKSELENKKEDAPVEASSKEDSSKTVSADVDENVAIDKNDSDASVDKNKEASEPQNTSA